MSMDPELKAKWIAALRSGEYEQGSSRLCRDGRFCCLGVLAAELGTPPSRMEHYDWTGLSSGPKALLKAVPRLIRNDLEHMNDSGKSFRKIADWIEANL